MLHILISLLGLINKHAEIPSAPEIPKNEKLIYQVQYRPSVSHDMWGMAVSTRAIYWLSSDLLKLSKTYAYHAIDISDIRHCTMAYGRSVVAMMVGGFLSFCGVMGMILLIGAEEKIPWGNFLMSMVLALVGLAIAIYFKGQPYLRIFASTRFYLWRPPFAFDRTNREKVKTIFAEAKKAFAKVNILVVDHIADDRASD